MRHDPYGPVGNSIGTLFWFIAFAAFTFPFWGPVLAFVLGVGVGVGL
jgi:uncharacterized membrane protein